METVTPVRLEERNIFLAYLFSILTCGIYMIYWFVCLTNDTNKLSKFKTASGGLAFLFNILSFGIYSLYWSYMLGKKIGDIEKDESGGVLYLVLSIFGLGIVVYGLAQSSLNRIAKESGAAY